MCKFMMLMMMLMMNKLEMYDIVYVIASGDV